MHYRCPYCKTNLGTDAPPVSCPHCRRKMRPGALHIPVAELRQRRRKLVRIDREAAAQLATMHTAINPRTLYSPRVLFAILFVLACIGTLLLGLAERRSQVDTSDIPHRRALRELDVLATGLGRYKFHLGHWPTPQPHGLLRLCNDYHESGWLGPYISHVRNDPWQMPYHYMLTTNDHVKLFSSGPDRTTNTHDDLYPDPASFDVGTEWTNGWLKAADRVPGVSIYAPRHDE